MAQRFVAAVKRMAGVSPSTSMLWCSVLPQNWDTVKKWYMENAEALAEAYIDATGKRPWNLSKEPPVEPVPEPPTSQPDINPTICGVKHWYEHLRTWNFHAAWDHLWNKHD
jgi:hypothetical protein